MEGFYYYITQKPSTSQYKWLSVNLNLDIETIRVGIFFNTFMYTILLFLAEI